MSVNLSKDQQISLSKSDGSTLIYVRMGLGCQAAPRKGFLAKLTGAREIDLDASAVLCASRQIADVVFFQHLTSDDGSVRHTGDNLTSGAELARYTLTGGGNHTAQIMAKVHRTGDTWQMKAIGEPATGRTFQDLLPSIAPHL
ncbi:export associated protein [Streptomyces spinoverrucosus]|uniref:Export associated protein n=1 Tax=Streptomyces spinoverrucosus TaxID=284043 RepID=A0A4Y3VNV1_9ACTN|nr:TerD family protein [Streptomyces spinoverrucosus]GEC08614.1 export associated protein [Streptomyces spinoverrucosus]GHB68818.1 export associated protein [Streptomyces spinoverrucosus]